ncbi:Nucleotide-binding alpha-beta plait [Penicillium malachiteum]|uniref:Nucleotide-binding alpha-beta plait n=1 Tax=Penicillium malachiteum TaxID=1324776 RepID=UPI00254941E6|nr:Nucleotide-binding alpha-beta plait [Penicillium malachiteum]KAJ5714609.1 Nucleotide-binding alpha-beta plait [Penicillium malachiteum]
MHPQGDQKTSSTSSGQNSSTQTGHYHHDRRPRVASMFSPNGNVYYDGTGGNMPQMFTSVAYPGYPRPRFGPQTASPVTMSNVDWVAYTRAKNATPYWVVPTNNGVLGGVQQASTFMSPAMSGQADQPGQYQYLSAGFYPTVNSMVPSGYQYPSWPYMNYNTQSVWNPVDIQKGPDASAQLQYYDGSHAVSTVNPSIQVYGNAGAVPSPCYNTIPVSWQIMKTTNGYMVQDLHFLTQQEPAIPRAVPAMWTSPDMTIAKCLENREGITNVYIRGFLPETTDELLHSYASRFGSIERCKAIVDLDTGLCKGFGFVQFYTYESCENCIRGFFFLGYQASFAQKSRNSRLKDLEDRCSTNIYCTNIPIDWTEADLRRHFEPYNVVSEKISRDEKTGVSKEVGFARFESREVAEKILAEFHNVSKGNDVKLLLRFADTKAQKILKQQSNERRAYRAGEYNFSVEVVQGSTPSPSMHRLQQASSHITPNSQGSFGSAAGLGSGSNWTPATSISPTFALMKKTSTGGVRQTSLSSRSMNAIENTPMYRRSFQACRSMTDISGASSKTAVPQSPMDEPRSRKPSPRKENIRSFSMSPSPTRMALGMPPSSPPSSPRSCC